MIEKEIGLKPSEPRQTLCVFITPSYVEREGVVDLSEGCEEFVRRLSHRKRFCDDHKSDATCLLNIQKLNINTLPSGETCCRHDRSNLHRGIEAPPFVDLGLLECSAAHGHGSCGSCDHNIPGSSKPQIGDP